MTRCKVLPGREDHFLRAVACGVEDDVVHFVPLAVDLVVVVEGLHAGVAAISVVVERVLELAFLGGELLDDLLGRDGGRGDIHVPESGIQRHGRKAVLVLRGIRDRVHTATASKIKHQ